MCKYIYKYLCPIILMTPLVSLLTAQNTAHGIFKNFVQYATLLSMYISMYIQI